MQFSRSQLLVNFQATHESQRFRVQGIRIRDIAWDLVDHGCVETLPP